MQFVLCTDRILVGCYLCCLIVELVSLFEYIEKLLLCVMKDHLILVSVIGRFGH